MKKILILLSLQLFIFCKAQTLIFERYGNSNFGKVENAYYKDIENFHDQYVGTWLYTNGTTSLKIIFQKRNQILNESIPNYYTDYLIGEYQYIENNIEKINTLSNINTNNETTYDDLENNHHLISISRIKFPSTFPQCQECLPDEKRLRMSLFEPNYDRMGVATNTFVIRKFVESGEIKLKVWFYNLTQTVRIDENGNEISSAPYILPTGEYVLTKQ